MKWLTFTLNVKKVTYFFEIPELSLDKQMILFYLHMWHFYNKDIKFNNILHSVIFIIV